jgi:putative DNA primase/helicase
LISPQARRELIDRVQATRTKERVHVATRLGWHRHAFVLPDGVISADGKKLWVHLERRWPARALRPLPHRRHLEGFREIARLAVGNSLMELGFCLAFAGPVAALLGVEQPGVMLVGEPGSWKTTLLATVASVWGRHTDPNMANKLGFGVPFNATGNDLEDEALAANHTLLAVDETRAADGGGDEREIAKVLIGTVMRWELGFEKGRKIATGPRRSTSVPFLLTSNKGARRAGGAGRDRNRRRPPRPPDRRAAARLRRHRLRGAARRGDDAASVPRLRSLAAEHFGLASRDFLRQLVERRAMDEAAAGLASNAAQFYLDFARRRIDAPGRQPRPRAREDGHALRHRPAVHRIRSFRGRRSGCWRRCCRARAATSRWWPATRPAPRGGKRRRWIRCGSTCARIACVRRPAARGN